MPTYLAIPLIGIGCFLAAVIEPLAAVARYDGLATAGILALVWFGLVYAAMREGNLEFSLLVAGALTLFGAGTISGWLAGAFGWPPALVHLMLVDVVLVGLAVANTVVGRRLAARDAAARHRIRL